MTSVAAARKKQLGQYFTGTPVARLLASLADSERAKAIIDPMAGSGDMLQACLELGATPDLLVGVDIDPVAVAFARERFEGDSSVTLTCGDAFSETLPARRFDLVITNPPYIRYQSRSSPIGLNVPSGDAIRDHLLRSIAARTDLSDQERQLFGEATRSYPRTADVAVPSWILAASLVAEEGVLAIVVPQAWLSRSYAQPVRDMLDRAFDVRFQVEDGDASWFPDAQVRTHLLVAHRRPVDGTTTGRSGVVIARATRALVDEDGRLTGDLQDERAVADALSRIEVAENTAVTKGLTARVERGPTRSNNKSGLAIQLRDVLPTRPTCTIDSYGWSVGQGMRTGANDVFYLTRAANGLSTDRRWGSRSVTAPAATQLPTVRRQSDLSGLHVDPGALATVLLDLRGWATRDDRATAVRAGVSAAWWDERYRVMPDDLAAWINEVAETPFSDQHPDRTFPSLSAVSPNAKVSASGEPLGYWYQLPKLAARHRPLLFMPRVCGSRPHAYANPQRAVVDANFATLWAVEGRAMPDAAMFALLNSTWVWANLELTCNVLGGGALKVEATDLRHLPLPPLDVLATEELTRLGKALEDVEDVDLLAEIDWIVARSLADRDADALNRRLVELASQGLVQRSHR